ncbi:MAG TPA: sialidase family protein [Actinomycetota bacterium]|nr:sialidase family protein [Actinomycetota bacterium]
MPLSGRAIRPAVAVVAAAAVAAAWLVPAGADKSRTSSRSGPAVAHRSGGKRVTAGGKRPVAVFQRVGFPAGEPTLAVTKKGDLFFPSIDTSRANHVELLRSTDDGESWDVASPALAGVNSHPISLDPYVYADRATSRVFNIDLTVACSILSFTDDGGKTWTTNPLACGRPVNDHQTLFSGPPVSSPTFDYPNVVYYCWNDVASSSCSKSLDGGITFSPTGSPAFTGVQPGSGNDEGQASFCGGLHGHGVVDRRGWVYLPKESCLRPWLAISRDEGRTWENIRVSDIPAGDGLLDPSVDVDGKGNIYYAWTGGDRRVRLTVSRDAGKSWSNPVIADAPGVREANLATLDVGAPGKVAIAYMGSENSPWRYGCDDDCPRGDDYLSATWNGYVTITTQALEKNPVFLSTRVNPNKDPLMRGTCGPGRCKTVFDFIDTVIAPDGTPYATFVDGCVGVCSKPNGAASVGEDGVVVRLVGGPPLR